MDAKKEEEDEAALVDTGIVVGEIEVEEVIVAEKIDFSDFFQQLLLL